MNFKQILGILLALHPLLLVGCQTHADATPHHEHHAIVVTSPTAQDATITQEYVCQVHSRRHIEVCALEDGYLEQVPIREGQAVKSGELLFRILPTLYRARLDAELAEVRTAQLELENSKKLFQDKVVSRVDVSLHEAKLAKAQADAKLAEAELNFTTITAPFDGIVDRLHEQQGSLVEEGDMLTTLSDNNVMWVYFNVPEARYLEYMKSQNRSDSDGVEDNVDAGDDENTAPSYKVEESQQIGLELADGSRFPHLGTIGAIEANFNNETGNIPFRADFPNPDGLLRHGQTGKVLIQQILKDAVVIPQRAVFEILAKQYVYVVDKDEVVHQREIEVEHELEDIFVIKKGVALNDKIVLEGVRQVRDGEKVEYDFLPPEKVLSKLKYKAE